MARSMIKHGLSLDECEEKLKYWISGYVNPNLITNYSLRKKYPLAQANLFLQAPADSVHGVKVVVFIKPWLYLEPLSKPVRFVVEIANVK